MVRKFIRKSPEEKAAQVDKIWTEECDAMFTTFLEELKNPPQDIDRKIIPQLAHALNPSSEVIYSGINHRRLEQYIKDKLIATGDYDNRFIGYKQAKDLGLTITKGSKSIPLLVYRTHSSKKELDKSTGEETTTYRKLAKPYRSYQRVFHMSAFENAPPMPTRSDFEDLPSPFSSDEVLDEMINRYMEKTNLDIVFDPSAKRALYRPSEHVVVLPPKEAFSSQEAFYAVVFHELVHSTKGDPSLMRDRLTPSGGVMGKKQMYAMEELVAELGGHSICDKLFIDRVAIFDSTYIDHYLNDLPDQKQNFISAVFEAERVANHIIEVTDMKPVIEMYKNKVVDTHVSSFQQSVQNAITKSANVANEAQDRAATHQISESLEINI